MEDNTLKVITAILGIVLIEITALMCGHNGTILALTIGSIAALGGYVTGSKKEEIKQYVESTLNR